MKKQGHPDYHDIIVIETNGNKYRARSTYREPWSVLDPGVDCHSHPAWKDGGIQIANKRAGRLSRHNKRYGGLGGIFDEKEGESEQ